MLKANEITTFHFNIVLWLRRHACLTVGALRAPHRSSTVSCSRCGGVLNCILVPRHQKARQFVFVTPLREYGPFCVVVVQPPCTTTTRKTGAPALEVLQIWKLTLSPCVALVFCSYSRAAWRSQFQFFQRLCGENAYFGLDRSRAMPANTPALVALWCFVFQRLECHAHM